MDDIFNNLKKQGRNDVDNLVKWMEDSKLIEATKEQEDKVRNMFKDAADIKNIELSKFKDVIQKLAAEQKKSVDELSRQLSQEGPRLMNAIMAGVSAFKDALINVISDRNEEVELISFPLLKDDAMLMKDDGKRWQ